MSVTYPFEFSKDWESQEDFPSVEPSETQARKDLQFLHNETLAKINEIITDHNNNIPAPLTNAEIDEATQ